MAQTLSGAVAQTPGTAVAFDQSGKRPLPARPEYAREQRLVAVTEVFDVLHVEWIGSGFEHCRRHSYAPVSEDRAPLILAQYSPDRNVPHARLFDCNWWRMVGPSIRGIKVLRSAFGGKPEDICLFEIYRF